MPTEHFEAFGTEEFTRLAVLFNANQTYIPYETLDIHNTQTILLNPYKETALGINNFEHDHYINRPCPLTILNPSYILENINLTKYRAKDESNILEEDEFAIKFKNLLSFPIVNFIMKEEQILSKIEECLIKRKLKNELDRGKFYILIELVLLDTKDLEQAVPDVLALERKVFSIKNKGQLTKPLSNRMYKELNLLKSKYTEKGKELVLCMTLLLTNPEKYGITEEVKVFKNPLKVKVDRSKITPLYWFFVKLEKYISNKIDSKISYQNKLLLIAFCNVSVLMVFCFILIAKINSMFFYIGLCFVSIQISVIFILIDSIRKIRVKIKDSISSENDYKVFYLDFCTREFISSLPISNNSIK